MTDQTDGVVTLRERVRERLGQLIDPLAWENRDKPDYPDYYGRADWLETLAKADAILREFALRPVSQGVVGEDGEVQWT